MLFSADIEIFSFGPGYSAVGHRNYPPSLVLPGGGGARGFHEEAKKEENVYACTHARIPRSSLESKVTLDKVWIHIVRCIYIYLTLGDS